MAEKKELWRKKEMRWKRKKCDDVKKRKEVLIISDFFNMVLGFKRVVPSKGRKLLISKNCGAILVTPMTLVNKNYLSSHNCLMLLLKT